MFRQFKLTLSSAPTSIFALLVAASFCDNLGNQLISTVKNDDIIPDRWQQVQILPIGSVTISFSDNSGSGSAVGTIPTTGLLLTSSRNSINIREILLSNAGNTDAVTVILQGV